MRAEYMHGGDIYRDPVEYDFSVNINPLEMPRQSLEAARRAMLLCGKYPDWQGRELCRGIAEREGILPEQIILGNGAAELIYALCFGLCCRTAGHRSGSITAPVKGLMTAPSFGEYEAALTAAGGEAVFWKLEEEKDFRLEEDVLTAITGKIRILFLCNPNNPTGSLAGRELLCRIAQRCEENDVVFCLDECFLPFLERERELSMKEMLGHFPHMVILRAFTKVYGMPGLRLGYAMSANEELLQTVRACLQPWNTSIPAQLAGIEALKDGAYLERTRQLIGRERDYLKQELESGLAKRIYPANANYLFFQAQKDLKELLLRQKVLIRSCADYRNLSEGYFRIGIRTHEENQELIRRWRKAVKML